MTFAFFFLILLFPPNLASISPIIYKWQQIYEIQDSKMAAAAISEKTLPVEPPL
jgi:hypothetical protein